jgi:hypothetical protein
MAKYTDQTFIDVYSRQDGVCAVCGEPLDDCAYEMHHMRRVADGGTNTEDNLVLICDRDEHLYLHGGDFTQPLQTTADDYPYFHGKSGHLEYQDSTDEEDIEKAADYSLDQEDNESDNYIDDGGKI